MADIGEKLRSAREAKGLSIEDIEKATKIQGRYLTAIEQNQFDKLPGDFYVRAFIRQYAQIVGLDGKELLSEYHDEVPQAEPYEYVEESIDNKSEEVQKTTSNKKKIWRDYLPRLVIGVAIIAVVLICYVVYAHYSASKNQTDNSANEVSVSSENTKKPKKPKQVKKNTVKIKDVATAQYQVTGLKKNRNLVVRAGNQATNVTISYNGVRQFAQLLNPSQKRTLRIPVDAHTVVVTFSNAAGTSISFGGKQVPYNSQVTGNTLTFYVGKRRSANETTANNNGASNNTTTEHHNNNNNSSQQTQNQQPANGTNNTQQHNGQTTNQNNGQNDQANSNNQNNENKQNNHSEGSSSEDNDGR